jgi:hypothetical protein
MPEVPPRDTAQEYRRVCGVPTAPRAQASPPHTHRCGGRADNLHAAVGRVVGPLALLAVAVADVVEVLLVKAVAGGVLHGRVVVGLKGV